MTFRIITFFFCCCLMLSKSASAQVIPKLKFNQLTVKDGLSTNAVRFVHEDVQGIMWIGTTKGLNRYDGTGFKIYVHTEGDEKSICNDVINSIAADNENKLWLGTIGGLAHFNPKTGTAVNYYHEANNPNSLASNAKCDPFIDHKGRLWLATAKGVQLFNRQKKTFTTFSIPLAKQILKPDLYNYFTEIKEDSQHRLWAVSVMGIYLIDEKNKKLVQKYNSDDIGITTSLYEATNGATYLGQFKKGLVKLNTTKNSIEVLQRPNLSIATGKVYKILEWKSDVTSNWLCIAATGGLTLLNMSTNVAKEFVYDPLDLHSLNAFTVYHLAKDKQHRLWLSTDNGISIVDPNLQNFENIAVYQQLKLNNPKKFGLPTNMLATDNEYLVTCYYRKGVYVFDKNWQLVKHIARIPENSKSELSKNINNIYKDANGDFWFSTDSGLVKKHKNQYQFFFPPNIDPRKDDEYAISKLYKRADGLFWIRAREKGIYLFDPVKGKFLAQYKPNGTDIIGTVYSCFLDGQSTLWVGATNSISRYVAKSNSFKKIKIKNEDGNECEVTWVTDINEDKENVIWAVSDKGLLKIDKQTNEGILLTRRSGLPENYLKRLIIDTAGQLWITSIQGIIKYDRKKTFTYFNVNNGLPVEYEGHGFFDFDNNGNLLMGSSGYVTRFNPYQIKTNLTQPNLVLLDFFADGNPVNMTAENGEKTVSLPPGTNILNLHFAITNYTATNENAYYYKLGKKTIKWQEVKNGDLALGSLPTGTYALFVRGSNNDDVFSKEEEITINVLPHWYETMLFYIFLASSIILITIFFVRRRIAFVRKESALKQQLAESELKAIRAQMNPHFIYNVLNSIEAYILEKDPESASVLVQKFSTLSRLILENSTQSLVPVSREWRALELYTELEAMRFENSFKFKFANLSTIDLNKILVPPMLVQPLIENAIHHGLRNALNVNSLVYIELSTAENHILFKIVDNGVGLSSTNKTKGSPLLKQQSLGLKAIEERVMAINSSRRTNFASFTICEITGEGKSGTEAVLILPIIKADGINL